MFGAISVKEGEEWKARVVQGRTADWKVMHPWGEHFQDSASGARDTTFGLPYFRSCSFSSQFPFAEVALSDLEMPLEAKVMGWSPFAPNKEDDASLPLAALE